MQKEYLTFNSRQTQKIGMLLANEILKTSLSSKPSLDGEGGKENEGFFDFADARVGERAFVIALEGDLGTGKTTFVQGFAKGLGIKEKILSPTFVILKKFKIKNEQVAEFKNFYHIDCYRIEKPKEILGLGVKKIISNPQNIVVIEWADQIQKILPKDILILKFKFIDEKIRKIMLK